MLLEETITCYSLDLEIKTAYGKELKNVWKFETDLIALQISLMFHILHLKLVRNLEIMQKKKKIWYMSNFL